MSQITSSICLAPLEREMTDNNNPSARQFQSAFKTILINDELKHIASGNCISLSDITILTYTKPHVAINSTTDRNRTT